MQRDMDLIRLLLLYFERRESFSMDCDIQIPDYTREAVQYQLQLLAQGGFIVYEASRSTTNPDRLIQVYPFGLSWAGHELLDAIRDPDVWNRTKDGAQKVGSFGVDVIKALAKGFLRKKIEEHTGVQIEL